MENFTALGGVAATLAGLGICAQMTTAALAGYRLRKSAPPAPTRLPPVTMIRPVCGLDAIERVTLRSTFLLPSNSEIIFCAARETDAAVAYLRALIAEHPAANATIHFGADGPGVNPKLDNVRKGWRAARNDWVVIADSNVLMDQTYLWNLLSAWRADTGAVCAPPFAIEGRGPWAAVETQYLNGYQGRWQYAADAFGLGFAQGKSMLFRKTLLESWGGIDALDVDTAEDAATTKVVRQHGYTVRLAHRTIPQPLGTRSLQQVWQRQCRWAQLRRQSFPALYLLEPLTMLGPTLALAAFAAATLELPMAAVAMLVTLIWVGSEVALAMAARWVVSVPSVIAVLAREMMAPCVWLAGWRLRTYTWRHPRLMASAPKPA